MARVIALLAAMAALSSSVDARVNVVTVSQATTAAPTTSKFQIDGNGNTITSKNTTVFLGTQYNPTKCSLQFSSLGCSIKNPNCGTLNGYNLTCVNVGMQDGEPKQVCRCKDGDAEMCQNQTSKATTGVPQFGVCTNDPCADTQGLVETTRDMYRVCAEKIHCVKEINTKATAPASICHTCMSCIAQNADQAKLDNGTSKLLIVGRFDCSAICPPEILKTVEARNKKGLGIAGSLGEDSAGSMGSDSMGSEAEPGTVAPAADKSGAMNVRGPMSVLAGVAVAVLGVVALY